MNDPINPFLDTHKIYELLKEINFRRLEVHRDMKIDKNQLLYHICEQALTVLYKLAKLQCIIRQNSESLDIQYLKSIYEEMKYIYISALNLDAVMDQNPKIRFYDKRRSQDNT